MRHLLPLAVSAALLLGALAVAEPAAAASPSSLSAGNALHVGEKLVSSNGAYTARLEAGQLVVRTTSGRMVWGTPKRTSAQTLYLGAPVSSPSPPAGRRTGPPVRLARAPRTS